MSRHSHSNSNVIHLDLASQKLLLQPDDPIPEFYPPPRAVMVTPIYNDADAFGQQPPSAGGSARGYRSHRDMDRDGGRRYYDDDRYDDYDRDRGRRHRNDGRRGGSSSPSYRGRYSPDDDDDDDNYDDYGRRRGFDGVDDMGDRKRSRVPGTEPPLLPPPDISHYPGGSSAHGHGHGRTQSDSYGRYGRDYERHARPHQSNKLRKRRSRDGYGGGGGYGRRDHGGHGSGSGGRDYPPTSDSDDYYPDDRYPDDDSDYSYTGGGAGGGRGGYGYAKRSRPEGTEPPKLPPPDISGYPGGGGGGAHVVQGVPGVHEGAGGAGQPPTAGHDHDHNHDHGHGHSGSQYPASQGYAGSQYSQQQQQQYPPHHGKKPGLIGRIFSGSARTHTNSGAYPSSGRMGYEAAHPGKYMASHRPSAVPGRPAPMSMSSSSGSSVAPHTHEGGRGAPAQGGAALAPPRGMKLSPITLAFLRIAAQKGYGDEITRYISQLPPSPQFCWGKCTGGKKAVLIGINYVGMKDELQGCANDARNMRDFLVNTWHFNPANIVLITDERDHRTKLRPTRREMFNAIAWLVHDPKPNDSLFFHYSGHGGQSKDASGREADGLDEVIYPLDYDDAGDIIDDEMHSALVTPLPAGVRLTAVFDSCHSGGMLDLPYLHSAHGRLRGMSHVSKRAQQRGAADDADVICISACKSDETSADTHEGDVAVGAMSYALIQSFKNQQDPTYAELLAHLREILIPKYNQKAQISGTHPLDLDRKFIL